MASRARARSAVAGALLVVGALGIAACSTSGGATDGAISAGASSTDGAAPGAQLPGGVPRLVQAAQTTRAVTTQHFTLTVETSGDGGPGVSVRSEGAFDAAAGRGRVTATIEGQGGASLLDGDVEAIYDGGDAYVRSSLLGGSSSKPWVKVSSDRFGEVVGELGGSFGDEPGLVLELLEGAAGTVTELGTEEVRGVEARHVAVDLDVEALLERIPADRRAELDGYLDRFGPKLEALTAVPAEVWVDDDGYVRRMSVPLDVGSLAPGSDDLAGATVTQTIELYDFDEPVTVEVPDPSQVRELDLGELFGN